MTEHPIVQKAIDKLTEAYKPIVERRCRVCENYTNGQISIHYCAIFCGCERCATNLIA